jgi:hypothetical protein
MLLSSLRPVIKTSPARSNTLATSSLGPTLSATLVTPSLEHSIRAYCGFLHHHVQSRGVVSWEMARQWGLDPLAEAPMAWLANELGEPWLRLIEIQGTKAVDPFRHSGWMSLEVSVDDVDALRSGMAESPFQIIGEPANLDVSDDIRAMQVIGPAGEVLYLTEIKAAVPPFELPFARCTVDRLFIPVLLATDREVALAEYEKFPGTNGVKFETKITVINRARKLDVEQRHPVATIQLHGSNLIEIDQLDGLSTRPSNSGKLPTGIAMITFAVESIPEPTACHTVIEGNYTGCKAALLRGAAGELIELIETDF